MCSRTSSSSDSSPRSARSITANAVNCFDVDPIFNNSEDWWLSIPPEIRPRKDQPYYHLFAENDETEYVAYVSEQNLLPDASGEPLRHPDIRELFDGPENGIYRFRGEQKH